MPSTRPGHLVIAYVALLMLVGISCNADSDDAPVPATTQPDNLTTSETTIVSTPAATDTAVLSPSPTVARRDDTPTATGVVVSPTAPTPTVPPVPTRLPPPPPDTVSGNGTTTSAAVTFPRGLAVVTFHHTGLERFRVRMQRPDGAYNRLVGKGTGTVNGSMGVVIFDAGEYVFAVEADGPWQIDILWPTPETAPVAEAPFHASGTGDQAVYFVLVQTGPHTLTMTHDGAKAYAVRGITSEGRDYWDKVSGVGPVTTTLEFEIRDKAFEFLLLNVEADANWTIDIQ